MKETYEYFKSQQAQEFKNKLQQIQGSAAKIESTQAHRIYTPRQRNDLSITDKTCDTVKPFEDLMREFKQTKITMQNGKLRK